MTGWITTIMTGINGTFSSFHRKNTSSIWKLGNILFQSKCRRSAAQRQRKNESCSSTGRWEQGQYGYSPGVVPGSNAAALPRPASGPKPRIKVSQIFLEQYTGSLSKVGLSLWFPRGTARLPTVATKKAVLVHCPLQTRYGARVAPQRCTILHIGKAVTP